MKRFVAIFILIALFAAPVAVWAASRSQTFQVSVYIPPMPGVNDHLAGDNSISALPKESQDSVTLEETIQGTETVMLKSVTIK